MENGPMLIAYWKELQTFSSMSAIGRQSKKDSQHLLSAGHGPGSVLCPLHTLSHYIFTASQRVRYFYYSHFTNEEQPMLLTSMLCCLPKILQMKTSDIYVIAFVGLRLYHSRGHISLSTEKLHLTCTLRCMKPGGSSLILSIYSLEDITGRTLSPTTTWCSLKAVEIQSLISLRV